MQEKTVVRIVTGMLFSALALVGFTLSKVTPEKQVGGASNQNSGSQKSEIDDTALINMAIIEADGTPNYALREAVRQAAAKSNTQEHGR